MDVRCEYVPLTWFNNGLSADEKHEPASYPMSTTPPPPPPYTEQDIWRDQKDIHPAFRSHSNEKQVVYATVRPSLPRLRTSLPAQSRAPPSLASPTSPRSSISSLDGYPPSLASEASSVSSRTSFESRSASISSLPRSLRRSGRRPRGLSLREMRQKQSEMDLQRAYSSSLEQYLSGDIFDNFRHWHEPPIAEDL